MGPLRLQDKVYGSMKDAEQELVKLEGEQMPVAASKACFMLLPLASMILGMMGSMLWIRNGDLASGRGSKSVLYAIVLACFVASLVMI